MNDPIHLCVWALLMCDLCVIIRPLDKLPWDSCKICPQIYIKIFRFGLVDKYRLYTLSLIKYYDYLHKSYT